ncbi:MAG: hypothetical protein KDB02_04675 [Acidimicrobiales bacterium]|nr:hypothetical protein [Acidimicrobiales bacterium]MCB1246639.1 hypothetical protein [Acidimicrobiia bacterium]
MSEKDGTATTRPDPTATLDELCECLAATEGRPARTGFLLREATEVGLDPAPTGSLSSTAFLLACDPGRMHRWGDVITTLRSSVGNDRIVASVVAHGDELSWELYWYRLTDGSKGIETFLAAIDQGLGIDAAIHRAPLERCDVVSLDVTAQNLDGIEAIDSINFYTGFGPLTRPGGLSYRLTADGIDHRNIYAHYPTATLSDVHNALRSSIHITKTDGELFLPDEFEGFHYAVKPQSEGVYFDGVPFSGSDRFLRRSAAFSELHRFAAERTDRLAHLKLDIGIDYTLDRQVKQALFCTF